MQGSCFICSNLKKLKTLPQNENHNHLVLFILHKMLNRQGEFQMTKVISNTLSDVPMLQSQVIKLTSG